MEILTATQLIQERLAKVEQPMGLLSKRQLSWLLAFTKYLFKCPRSEIGISTVMPLILLAPVMNNSGDSEYMTQDQFDTAVKTFNVRRHQVDLPNAMDLIGYRIEFTRIIEKNTEI